MTLEGLDQVYQSCSTGFIHCCHLSGGMKNYSFNFSLQVHSESSLALKVAGKIHHFHNLYCLIKSLPSLPGELLLMQKLTEYSTK